MELAIPLFPIHEFPSASPPCRLHRHRALSRRYRTRLLTRNHSSSFPFSHINNRGANLPIDWGRQVARITIEFHTCPSVFYTSVVLDVTSEIYLRRSRIGKMSCAYAERMRMRKARVQYSRVILPLHLFSHLYITPYMYNTIALC